MKASWTTLGCRTTTKRAVLRIKTEKRFRGTDAVLRYLLDVYAQQMMKSRKATP